MPEQARHLITSADERTWKLDRSVIFLGDWCRLYERKEVWGAMNAIVATPYGLEQSTKDKDEAEIRRLDDQLFPLLCDILNEYHATAHGLRFWKVLLGHWMRTYMSTVFNRYRTIEQCLERYHVTSTTTVIDERYSLAPADALSATLAANDDLWNQALYSRIISATGNPEIAVEVLSIETACAFLRLEPPSGASLPRRGLRLARGLFTDTLSLLKRDTDAFIINSYLPRQDETKLQLALGQIPQFWEVNRFRMTSQANPGLRKKLAAKLAPSLDSPLQNFLHAMVLELLPVCYLEGFQELVQEVGRLNWPKHPKFIFTSNNFDNDEVFKLWAAGQVERGTPYYTGQHGGNYGSRRIPRWTVEEETGDKFITWGWTDGMPQHKPAFLLKTGGSARPASPSDPEGKLLLIQEHMNHRIPAWDDVAEFALRWEEQLGFIRALESLPRRLLTMRLHPAYRGFSWSDVERMRDFDPTIAIDTGELSMKTAVANSRLLIFSYDSSGIQEALSQNIPVIVFWRTGLDFVRDSAKPFFHALIDAGLFHLTAASAARKVNEIAGDVQAWWTRPDVQIARIAFCHQFARSTTTPITDLKKVLLS